MTVKELTDKLSKYDPDTEVQAVVTPGYKIDLRETDTGDPIIEEVKETKGGDYIIIRA